MQVDPLWSNDAALAIRVAGIIYNADTFLWADLYLILFANGVAHVSAHFVNVRLHIQGYGFQGLPFMRLKGEGIGGENGGEYSIPVDGLRFSSDAMSFNFSMGHGCGAVICGVATGIS